MAINDFRRLRWTPTPVTAQHERFTYSLSIDESGEVLNCEVSEGVESLLGINPFEINNLKGWETRIVQSHQLIYDQHLDSVINGDVGFSAYRVGDDEDDSRWIVDSAKPVYFEDEVVRIDGVLVDLLRTPGALDYVKQLIELWQR